MISKLISATNETSFQRQLDSILKDYVLVNLFFSVVQTTSITGTEYNPILYTALLIVKELDE